VVSQRKSERQKGFPDPTMRNGNEGLAREALTRRQQYIEQSKSSQHQLEADKLNTTMKALKAKILEATA
jgi:phage shock protein A